MYSVWNMECGIGMWAGLTDVTDAGVFPSAGSLYYKSIYYRQIVPICLLVDFLISGTRRQT